MIDDLKLIKNYGENMMHFTRNNFATILEEDKLYEVLSSKFAISLNMIISFLLKNRLRCQMIKKEEFSKEQKEQINRFNDFYDEDIIKAYSKTFKQ